MVNIVESLNFPKERPRGTFLREAGGGNVIAWCADARRKFSLMAGFHVWMPLIRTGTGAEVYTRVLARRLRERGHRVTLDVVPHAFQYFPWLAPIAAPRDADVTLANSWYAAAFASRRLPVVSVCHLVVHDDRLAPYKTWARGVFHRHFVRRMERAAVRRAAANVAVGPMVARQMKAYLGAERVVIVNNGVDTDFFRPGEDAEGEGDRPFRLLFVGKPSLRKGFDIIARIVGRLGNDVQFVCAGPEPAEDLPRPDGIYLGVLDREAVREAYRGADLLLFPSRMEGLSLAVAEAMACGLPVLTCEGSAMDDFVTRDAGIVRAEHDIDGFVADIERVMHEPARHRTMRRLSREIALTRLAEGRWVTEMEGILARAWHGG